MNHSTRVAVVSLLAVSGLAGRAATIDGSLDAAYGGALSVQTANTGFGADTAANGGNQLDAAYGYISGGYLNLFFAGNTSDGNYLDVFLADGRTGQSTFNVTGGGFSSTSTESMDGSVFSPGFSATYSLHLNTYAGTIYANLYDLVAGTGGYAGSAPDAGGTVGGVMMAVNNSSPAGTGSNTGTGALAVNTGWEIAIPVSYLGGSPSSVNVLADINGGNEGYLSNQFLPGLPDGTANLGGGGGYSGPAAGAFDFGSTPGKYLTVATVPEPGTLTIGGLAGLVALGMIRRRH
jgi:hypothetical protein